MITTQELAALGASLGIGTTRRSELVAAITRLWESSAYQGWRSGGLSVATPFELGQADIVLEEAGLVRDRQLRVIVNRVEEALCVTDGPWVPKTMRTFPFSDESRALCAFARERDHFRWADWIVDLATGCGHTLLASNGGQRVGLDINPRALAYLSINRALNEVSPAHCLAVLNDLRLGLPDAVVRAAQGKVLYVGNVPFGPSPGPGTLALTSDGGERGSDLLLAALRAIAGAASGAPPGTEVRACLMALTVGSAEHDRWDAVELARQRFGSERVRWTLLREEKLLRISGIRELSNPHPIREVFTRIAQCRLNFTDAERPDVLGAYEALAARLEAQGFSHVAYGMIDVHAR